MTTVDLRSQAIAESRRLGAARALLDDLDEPAFVTLEGDAAWIAVARRAKLRRSLGRRVCLIWRVAFEDPSGRLVEWKVVPVMIETPPTSGYRQRSDELRQFVRLADAIVGPQVEAECAAWRAEVVRMTQAFSSARQHRQHEAVEPANAGAFESQPGLFDRRVERLLEARAAAAEERERAQAARARTIRAAAHIVPVPPRLMLVLAP